MATIIGDVIISMDKCKGCGLCIDACPQEILAFSKEVNSKGYLYAEKIKDDCTGCANCATVCPDVAIKVYRKKVS